MKITLLGASGYIGRAFAAELRRRSLSVDLLSRARIDYTRFETLMAYLREVRPSFVINAAGYTGKPNVDACEMARADTLQGNSLFPAMVAHACAETRTPWGHVSSGCIYSGARVNREGSERVEADLSVPVLRELYERDASLFKGFTEDDSPNFSFRAPPCSFYSGSKALGEEAIAGVGCSYIWRLRIPFDHMDNSRNYLSKIQRYPKVYDNINSISHRGDFAKACLDSWEMRIPYGIYNVTNPGAVTSRQMVEAIRKILRKDRVFEYWKSDEEFYQIAAKAPRSNCILDVSKLLATGVRVRPVEEAVEHALRNWIAEA